MEGPISDFIEYCLQQAQPENKLIVLGQVSEAVVERLIQESNIDLTGYVFTVDVYAVKHILKSHGNAQKEEKRGQRAVEADHFDLIYSIVSEPDVVFYDGKNRIGRDVLQFQKRIGDQYIILKEVRTGRKQLALNGMRIIQAKRNQG